MWSCIVLQCVLWVSMLSHDEATRNRNGCCKLSIRMPLLNPEFILLQTSWGTWSVRISEVWSRNTQTSPSHDLGGCRLYVLDHEQISRTFVAHLCISFWNSSLSLWFSLLMSVFKTCGMTFILFLLFFNVFFKLCLVRSSPCSVEVVGDVTNDCFGVCTKWLSEFADVSLVDPFSVGLIVNQWFLSFFRTFGIVKLVKMSCASVVFPPKKCLTFSHGQLFGLHVGLSI